MSVGEGGLTFNILPGWGQLPQGRGRRCWTHVVGIAVDSHDHVFVLSRTETPVMVFDQGGTFLGSWGEGVFTRPHGIHIGPDDSIFCADARDHTVRKFTPAGQLVKTWGTKGQASDTGYDGQNRQSIMRGAGPFNRPTNSAVASSGELYVSDGYGNARVHKFGAAGEHLLSWGEPGEGPGQFRVVHGVQVDPRGRVLVCDRENGRVQVFSGEGSYLAQWNDLERPEELDIDGDGIVYVAEDSGRVSMLTLDGMLLGRWGQVLAEGASPEEELHQIHTLAVDSRGDLYVASQSHMETGFLRKFVRQR